MEKTNVNVWLIAVLALLIGGLIGSVAFSTHTVENKPYPVPVIEYVDKPVADNTTLDIRNKLFEDDDFEVIALNLAEDKLDDDDLFDFLVEQNVSIVDVDDISSVTVDDSDVSNIDAEDKDAEVVLNLIVRYEDSDGDHRKVYVDGTFNVDEGKIRDRDVSYELA